MIQLTRHTSFASTGSKHLPVTVIKFTWRYEIFLFGPGLLVIGVINSLDDSGGIVWDFVWNINEL